MMQNQDFKYQPLKDCDNEEDNSPPYNEEVAVVNPCRIHWSFKLLFIVFLLAQVFYVIFKSDFQYFKGNKTKVSFANCIGEECPDAYDEWKFVAITPGVGGDEETKEGISKKSTTLSPPPVEPQHHPVYGSAETQDTASSAQVYDYTQIPPDYYNNSLVTEDNYSNYPETKTTTTSSSNVESNDDLLNLFSKIFADTTRSIVSNESTTKASTSVHNDLTTVVNITSIADNSTQTSNKAAPIATFSNDAKEKTQSPRKYFINTSRCRMPYVDPFTNEIRKIFHPRNTTGCTKDEPIITSHYDELNREYTLRTNYTVALQLDEAATNDTIADDLRCCYREIERSGSGGKVDKQFTLLPCTNFPQNFVVPDHIKGIITNCTSKKTNRVVQQDAFSFVQVKQTDRGQPLPKRNVETSGRRNLGILLIGIDTISRINVRRVMPRTFKYIMENGFYELKGYNKIGENTLPNLVALLTGYEQFLDNCNFIWTNMSDHGFVTAYAEDSTFMGTFNFNKKGFLKPPTDYYFRPMALALDRTLHSSNRAGLKYCIGRHQSGEYIYDYGMQFAKRFKNQSNFGLFWTNSFSHSAYDTAATMDTTMQHYLEDLEMNGIMETSVVVFFSDHGSRWGSLVKLPEGFLEQRLPMFFISLPKWFKQEYPDLLRNLEVNQQRLATPFDIYMTLQHLLQLTSPTYKMTPAFDCAQAQSILQELPEDRTCETACIPEAWCTCIPYVTLSTKSNIVKEVTQLILKEMNNYLAVRNMSSMCSELTLKRISKAFLRDVDHADHSPSNIATYRINFSTNPKTKPITEFGAIVDYDTKRRSISINVEDISRQSMYEKTAHCTDDKQLKKYCICKSSLTTPPREKSH